jgi:hypothetical protein
MVSLTSRTRSIDAATLVEVLVTADTPTRVRVANRLDGPVWPPRTQGVPIEGWDDDCFEGVVDGRLVFGYATPAEPAKPPVEIVSTEPVDDRTTEEPTPATLVRSLGDGRPPRDAAGRTGDACDSPADEHSTGSPPAALTDWLDAVERRLETADRLAQASSVTEASEAVAAAGGSGAVLELRAQLAADRAELVRLRSRCDSLAGRVERVELPAEALTRLA